MRDCADVEEREICGGQHGRSRIFTLALASVALAVVSLPLVAQQPGVLDGAQDFYRTTARSWLGPIASVSQRLFVALAALEIAISGLLWTMRRDSLDEVAAKFLVKFIVLSFVLLLITGASVWLRPIVNSLAFAGRIAGVVAVPAGPSEVVDVGIRVAFSNLDTSGVPISLSSMVTVLTLVVARFVILGAFFIVATLLVLAWVESYVALAGGVLFLGFGGFRATAQYAENYLNYLVYLGVRLFLIYLLLGAGMTIVDNYIPTALRVTTAQEMAEVLAVSVIFAAIVVVIPRSMASRVASGASFGLANALRSL
jgi:type IV secretion system protein TrbL